MDSSSTAQSRETSRYCTTANGSHQANLFWWGNAAIDYAGLRGPGRNNLDLSLTRDFRIKERYNLQIRAEFVNIFNRTQIGNPSTSNPAGPLTHNAAGQVTGGFGAYNLALATNAAPSVTSNGVVGQLYQQPRQGTLVARFTF